MLRLLFRGLAETQQEPDDKIPDSDAVGSSSVESPEFNPVGPEETTETPTQTEAPKTIGEQVTAPTKIVYPF
jgi:hypothetical protein